MRVVATGALDRQAREIHIMLAHVVFWYENEGALVVALVTGDTFLLRGEDGERLRARLLAME